MAEVINLRLARKTRARREAEAQASANRAKFGRTKAQKAAEDAARERLARHVDGHALPAASGDENGNP